MLIENRNIKKSKHKLHDTTDLVNKLRSGELIEVKVSLDKDGNRYKVPTKLIIKPELLELFKWRLYENQC